MDDRSLLAAFRSQTLPSKEWTHEAHLRVAFCHLREGAFTRALDRMRSGIRSLNDAHGTPNTNEEGYHETLTVAWLRLVAQAMRDTPDVAGSQALLVTHPSLSDKRRLLRYYSRDVIMSERARAEFVEPDLEPFPALE